MSLSAAGSGCESQGSDYEVTEEANTDSTSGNETESEHEAEAGTDYKFSSDEEAGSESEIDPDKADDGNDPGNGDKSTDETSDEEKEIKHLLQSYVTRNGKNGKDTQLEKTSDDKERSPGEVNQLLDKETRKNREKSMGNGETLNPKEGKDKHVSLKGSCLKWPTLMIRSPDRRRRVVKRLNSRVKFPTGNVYSVAIPQAEEKYMKDMSRDNKTILITLRPDGRMGKTEYGIVEKEMEKTRVNHISGSFSGYDIVKIQKVVNSYLWRRYRDRRREVKAENDDEPNERMMFHGSPAHGDLIQHGFDERYSSKNGMFGAGLYFAKNSSKSNQYVYGLNGGKGCPSHGVKHCMICERVLLLCRVTLGNTKKFKTAQVLAHPPPGFHSVEGVPTPGGLMYSETIVYRGEQVYPEFLITYKLKP